MAFKQESHCLHKSSGSEEEEIWLHVFMLHQHAPPSKNKNKKKALKQSSSADVYKNEDWPQREEMIRGFNSSNIKHQ